jgi:hypothetical protein
MEILQKCATASTADKKAGADARVLDVLQRVVMAVEVRGHLKEQAAVI